MTAALRCGLRGLPAAEAGLVRTLFKLYPHGVNDFRWVLVDAPPYDALLVDSTVDAGAWLDDQTPMTAVLTLGPASGLPNALTRPLRSELLEAWLLQTQQRLLDERQAAVSALPAAPSRAAQTAAPTEPPAPLAAPATPQIDTVPTPASVDSNSKSNAGANPADDLHYKLLRWPPAAMLRNDPTQIRMATVLSRRAMRTGELAQLAQQPLEVAQAFVASMRGAGLLTVPAVKPSQEAVRPAEAPRASAALPAHAARAPHAVERSLLSRIRLRLGLGR